MAAPAAARAAPRTGATALARALAAARARRPAHLAALARWVAVPSVSGDARRRDDVARAAAMLARLLTAASARVRRLPVPGAPPLVVGRVPGPVGTPTVLLYGHVDVVAAGPGWTTPAFAPALRGGCLYGRGTDDDKGQLVAAVAALDAWRVAGGAPCTVWVVAESAEEVGSPGLAAGLARLSCALTPDLVLLCDTERGADGVPSVTVSQRGRLGLEVAVDTGGPPVHPGRLGGAVVDPGLVLGRVLGRLAAVIDGWPRAGLPDHPRLRERTDRQVVAAAGGRATVGRDLDRRITRGRALSVLALEAGAAAAAVPSRARARLDVRLAPADDVATAVGALRAAALAAAPPGVRLSLTTAEASPGHAAVPGPRQLAGVDAACRGAFGRPPVLVRSGGSLPAAALLARAFPTPPVLLGLGMPAGNAHGPDEHLDLAGWADGVGLLVRLLAGPLGRAPPTRRRVRVPRARTL